MASPAVAGKYLLIKVIPDAVNRVPAKCDRLLSVLSVWIMWLLRCAPAQTRCKCEKHSFSLNCVVVVFIQYE